jgi:hypothetical protein
MRVGGIRSGRISYVCNMKNTPWILAALLFNICSLPAQTIFFEGQTFEVSHVKAAVVMLNGADVLRLERDLTSLPFGRGLVDEPTFLKLSGLNMQNGTVEVKVLSRLLPDAPPFARGFIGVAFRVNEDNTEYESIYIRPANGRADDQIRRNHAVQYYSYPDYKFDRLRKEYPERYETYADIGLDEWITMRIEFRDKSARLFLNNQSHPSFIVNDMLGTTGPGSVGLWVEIGTEGYFKDLIIRD